MKKENTLFQIKIQQNTTKSYKTLEKNIYICYNSLYFKNVRYIGVIMADNYSENWVGIDEAASHLGVTKDTIRNWIKKTDIPARKIGKLWKFKLSELDEWVKSGKSAI